MAQALTLHHHFNSNAQLCLFLSLWSNFTSLSNHCSCPIPKRFPLVLIITVAIFLFFFLLQEGLGPVLTLMMWNIPYIFIMRGKYEVFTLCWILGCRYKFLAISTIVNYVSKWSVFVSNMEKKKHSFFPRSWTWNSSTVVGDDLTNSVVCTGRNRVSHFWAGLPTWAGLQVGVSHWTNAHFSCTLPKHK